MQTQNHKTDDNGNAMLQSFLSKLFKEDIGWRYSRTAAMGNTGTKCLFFQDYLFTLLYAAELALSRWKLSTRWSKKAHAPLGFRSRHRINPRLTGFVSGKAGECRWQPRRYQVDPWCKGREVARGVLRSSPKPGKMSIFCHRRGIENFCRLFSTQQRPNVFVSDARPAHTTYHRSFCEHCDQRWVGAPNEHAPFRFHGTVVGFVDRCLSRTRNLAASN